MNDKNIKTYLNLEINNMFNIEEAFNSLYVLHIFLCLNNIFLNKCNIHISNEHHVTFHASSTANHKPQPLLTNHLPVILKVQKSEGRDKRVGAVYESPEEHSTPQSIRRCKVIRSVIQQSITTVEQLLQLRMTMSTRGALREWNRC